MEGIKKKYIFIIKGRKRGRYFIQKSNLSRSSKSAIEKIEKIQEQKLY